MREIAWGTLESPSPETLTLTLTYAYDIYSRGRLPQVVLCAQELAFACSGASPAISVCCVQGLLFVQLVVIIMIFVSFLYVFKWSVMPCLGH